MRVTARAISDSPLTSPEPSEPSSSIKRTAGKKRQRIESDDDEARDKGTFSGDDLPVPVVKGGRRRPVYRSEEDEDANPSVASQYQDRDHDAVSGHPRERRGSTTSATYEGPPRFQKKKAVKSKGKVEARGPPLKKRSKNAVHSDDFDVSDEFDGESDEMEVESDGLSEASEEHDYHKLKGKGKTGGNRGVGRGSGRRGAKDIAVKAKDEGARAKSESVLVRHGPAKGLKPPRSATKRRFSPALDDMDVDVRDSQPTRSGIRSQPAPGASSPMADEGKKTKEDGAVPPPPKKRKLPTIKKTKIIESSAPSTPPSTAGLSKLVPAGVSTAGETKGKGVLDDIKPATSTGTRLTAARVGIADLDLTNKNVYDQLFKPTGTSGPGSNRRANEERRKECDAMRNDWKARREAEQMQTPPFDLQAQNEKVARFEERLRSIRSGALYPNYMGGKWRQLWERERSRAKEQSEQEGRPLTHGVVNGREDGGERS